MKINQFVAGLIFVSIVQQGCASYTPNTTVTVHVVDEAGIPIPGATMNMGFSDGGGAKGETDAEGRFVVSGSVGSAAFGGTIEKEGYYRSAGILWTGGWTNRRSAEKTEGGYFPIPHRSGAVLLKPPSDFTITLKRIIDPVPMFHKRAKVVLPELGKKIGFDLEAGDWVHPYGKGKIADFVFEGSKEVVDRFNYSVTVRLSFTNPDDGIREFWGAERLKMESNLVGPQSAPIEGYRDNLLFKENRTRISNSKFPMETYFDERQRYLFRTRSEKDSNGNLVRAAYGKIVSPFGFDPLNFETIWISFDYFFNADPDPENRSLEYNGENLLTGYNDRGFPE